MAAIAGILNRNTTAAQALAGTSATPKTAASSTSSSSSTSATISANDFLTLLVTEMQNQDPTADTDPNEYINQLVNVNSLEQLISINQTLSTDLTPAASTTKPVTHAIAANGSLPAASAQEQPAASDAAATVPSAISAAAAKLAPGNLSLPSVNQSAQAVAQSLSGRPRVP